MTHPSGSSYRPTPKRGLSALVLVAFLGLALPFATTLAQGQPSGSYGSIAIGSSLQNTLANPQGQLTYHTYTVDIPAGVGQLIIEIDGLGNDIDLAVRFGAEITSYQEPDADFDFADFSEEPNPSYVLDNPSPGVLYLDVINLVDRDATYTITVSGGGQPAAGNPLAPSQGDPLVGIFAGDGLTITVEGANGQYTGQLELGGQIFPFTAEASGGTLNGTFDSGGSSFSFVATLEGDALSLVSGSATYNTFREAGNPLGGAPTAAPTQAPQPASPAPTGTAALPTGSWTGTQDFGFGVVTDYTLYFVPGNRYIYVESGDFPVQEEGSYRLEDDQITFLPYCGNAESLPIGVVGDRLTLGDEDTRDYIFDPGSEVTALQEIAELDAGREPANARWRAAIPLGPIQPGPTPFDPLRSNDPNPSQVFPGATVFAEGELYTYISSHSYVKEIGGGLRMVDPVSLAVSPAIAAQLDISQGEWRDSQLWFFYGNGRAFSKSENYFTATGFDPVTPSIQAIWGRYRLLGEDRVEILSDEGEPVNMQLYDGRRTLSHDGFCYDEVTWATEQLEE